MTTPRRIQLSRAKGWRLPAGAIVVSRPTPWGNPFLVGRHGTATECVESHLLVLAGFYSVVDQVPWQEQRATRNHVLSHLGELVGRDLACWCRYGAPCHADTLLRLASFWPRAPQLWPCVDRQGRKRVLIYPPGFGA